MSTPLHISHIGERISHMSVNGTEETTNAGLCFSWDPTPDHTLF